MTTKPIPARYNTVTPYLAVTDVPRLIAFLTRVFGVSQTEMITMPDGTILHAELNIGNSIIMLGSAPEQANAHPSILYVYCEDTDGTYKRALEAGATSVMEPSDQFYGDRNAAVRDAFGNQWWIATHVEDVSTEEMIRRAASRKPRP